MIQDILNEIMENTPTSIEELEDHPLYSILIVIGGYLAIGLGSIHFLLSMAAKFGIFFLFHFIVNIVFGMGLLVCNIRIEKDLFLWGGISAIFSMILIVFGGPVGTISGIISIIGFLMAMTKDRT